MEVRPEGRTGGHGLTAAQVRDPRIEGSAASRYLRELLQNSLHFPVLIILVELLHEGPSRYLAAPDLYAILAGGLVQGAVLAFRARGRPAALFAGNLAGPGVYTVIEVMVEGTRFFAGPQHQAYWIFALAIGLLQATQASAPAPVRAAAVVAEGVVRSAAVFAMYVILEVALAATHPGTDFLRDPGHAFVGLTTLLLGALAGVAELHAARYLSSLRDLSTRLKQYSEWWLGRALLSESLDDPSRLALRRERRAVLFADVRGFTAWSEAQSPEIVAAFVAEFYRTAEEELQRCGAIKYKFTGDEVMAVLPDGAAALAAATGMRDRLRSRLADTGVAIGIGVHEGVVMEGLFGTDQSRQYDVIGDTVNTAKRMESAARGGEVVVDAALAATLQDHYPFGATELLEAKGKRAPIAVTRLAATRAAAS